MSANVRLQWKGLDELLRELGSLPAHLQTDGMAIVREETEGAAQEMQQAYPTTTRKKRGARLKTTVRTIYPSSNLLIGIARAVAPHAHLYEFGTKDTERKTLGKGKIRAGVPRGQMPAPKQEITPRIGRRRRANMARRLIELLRRHGFQIGGE